MKLKQFKIVQFMPKYQRGKTISQVYTILFYEKAIQRKKYLRTSIGNLTLFIKSIQRS